PKLHRFCLIFSLPAGLAVQTRRNADQNSVETLLFFFKQKTAYEIFEIQSRARALDNNMYVVAPNMGTYYLFPEDTMPIDTFGGRSFVINYKGQIVGRQEYGAGSTYVAGVIDIEALRDHRARAQWDNWM